jgi:hypothetical protein
MYKIQILLEAALAAFKESPSLSLSLEIHRLRGLL